MSMNPLVETAAYFVGVAGTTGGVFSFFRYGNYKQTVQLQNNSIAALEKNNQILTKGLDEYKVSHLKYVKEIGVLEGQVRIYKDLQLEKMAEAMANISLTNKQILDSLRRSADIAAEQQTHSGVLVDTSGSAGVE